MRWEEYTAWIRRIAERDAVELYRLAQQDNLKGMTELLSRTFDGMIQTAQIDRDGPSDCAEAGMHDNRGPEA